MFAFLKSLIPYISSSEGCMLCEVLRSQESKNSFVVIEKLESEQAHKLSIEKFTKEKMQAAMPLFGAPPKGGFYHA